MAVLDFSLAKVAAKPAQIDDSEDSARIAATQCGVAPAHAASILRYGPPPWRLLARSESLSALRRRRALVRIIPTQPLNSTGDQQQ